MYFWFVLRQVVIILAWIDVDALLCSRSRVRVSRSFACPFRLAPVFLSRTLRRHFYVVDFQCQQRLCSPDLQFPHLWLDEELKAWVRCTCLLTPPKFGALHLDDWHHKTLWFIWTENCGALVFIEINKQNSQKLRFCFALRSNSKVMNLRIIWV